MAGGAAGADSGPVTLRILVVDDSSHFRRTLRDLLAARGFTVFHAAVDGDEALAALAAGCPDGALVDINLPGRDGFAVAASVAARCPTTPIVLISSDLDDVPPSALDACGAVAFVPKTELATTDLDRLFTPAGR
jgi:two-component system, NarL family, response regulator DesR